MSAANLLNLNVDTLFEQHSVAEIDIVQKKIQAEVEKKREELRTMVGERYRDLLKAADSITTMRDTSGLLVNQVECITTNCRSLNEKQLIGFKTGDVADVVKSRSANKQLNNYFSTMIQIKLLTSLPEMIWSHIDSERFFAATELFIFSRHISTGLQLDVNNTLMKFFPVAKKQWEILKPFHGTIKQKVLAVLEREQLSVEMATDCLMSLLLLEQNNLNGILKTFLQLRCAAYLGSLTEEKSDDKRRVKDRILASLNVLNSTMDLIWKNFFDAGDSEHTGGLVLQKLANLSDPKTLPTLSLMDGNDAQFSYMLPDIIANFRPKCGAQILDEAQGRATIEQWLADTSRVAGVHLKSLFELIPSMNAIQEIKRNSLPLKKHPNFAMICTKFQLSQSLDFYESQYMPLINERIRDIIRQSWLRSISGTVAAVERRLKSAESSEQSPTAFLWNDNSNDLPHSLKDALSDDRKMKKLLMKMKGYDLEIINICLEFDEHLQGIITEMSELVEEQHTRPEEKLALIDFLRDTSHEQISDFITQVKGLNPTGQREQLFIVRLFPALVELCPNLKICMCQQSRWRQHLTMATAIGGGIQHSESWNRVCSLLEDEALIFWKKLIEGILEENQINTLMPTEIGYEAILREFANWETITIEQKDEQDNPVKSTFRIPCQPRISLQKYLFNIARSLNAAIPQTLPQKVLTFFNSQLVSQLLQHYKSLSTHQFTASSQNTALQIYFDMKFLQAVFITREDRSQIMEFQAILSTLKEFIDPFDFELFSEHISTNVKRSVSKMHCQLGVIIASSPTSATPSAIIVSQHEKDPNVLGLSSNGSTSIWFPLLPIISSGSSIKAEDSAAISMESKPTSSTETEKTPTKKSSSSLSTRRTDPAKSQNVTSNVKSGAAAFFGAMSQDWFR